MTASASFMRSPRSIGETSYQNISPRLPSPLNPSPSSYPPPLSSGHILRGSPHSLVSEMSDTLSPLRERLDLGLSSSPWPLPGIPRPRASSLSRSPLSDTSPERSPVLSSILPQPYGAYAFHPAPNSGSVVQGVPFPGSRCSSPFSGVSQSPISRSPRPLSPSSSAKQNSPVSIHDFQTRSLLSLPHVTQSHLRHSQGSPVQVASSPSARYPRTQSLIQQSFEDPYCAQVASSTPSNPRSRPVSLSAESRPYPGSPVPVGYSLVQGTSMHVRGDPTPLNEASTRWWGGRSGWADDWDNITQEPQGVCEPCVSHLGANPLLGSTMGTGCVHPVHNHPLTFQEPFGRGVAGPGAFSDEEIHASFNDVEAEAAEFAGASTPGHFRVSMGVNSCCQTEDIPPSRALPVPVSLESTGSRMWSDGVGYGEVKVGPPPVDGVLVNQRTPDKTHRPSSHFHSRGSAGGLMPEADGTKAAQGYEHEHVRARGRRFSDASTHSSSSYLSCKSVPPQSQSQAFSVSSSQSHTSPCPSLYSLGIGIEEAEREELRSRTIWRRRHSGSTIKQQSKDLSNDNHGDDPENIHSSHFTRVHSPHGLYSGKSKDSNSKQFTHKDTVKHGSMFFRVGSKHEDVSQEEAQREGYHRAEKYVSLAIMSILPAATITRLSPVGGALIKARESVKFVGHELAPVVKDTLAVSSEVLSLAPLPGLEEAAKALLLVWNACQKVDTNRLSCLRLAERCATLLYSVRCDMDETGIETMLALSEPVERLCGALGQIRTFLETQLHRPFLKRYVRREEIARELEACNEAITDAASRFGISVQIRTFQESKRFAQEAHALLLFDQQMMQRHYAMMCGQSVQSWRQEVAVGFSNEHSLGPSTDEIPMNGTAREDSHGNGGCLTPPPAYGPPSQLPQMMPPWSGHKSLQNTPASSVLSTGYPSDVTNLATSLPPTPTPTRSTFAVVETKTGTMTSEHPASPMSSLVQMHSAQDSVDAAGDEAALRGRLASALDARSDVEMVRCLQVARREIPEAAEALRRMLCAGPEATKVEESKLEGQADNDMPDTEFHKIFMQNGIEAMTRLANTVATQARDMRGEMKEDGGAGLVSTAELPSWAITRYEVTRKHKIGVGSFSDVYVGNWRNRAVVVKVLAHSVSREAFVRHVELWHMLDHPNVLPLYGASSALGEEPWFFVSKFCDGGDLVTLLKFSRKAGGIGNDATRRTDLLRYMHEIAKGMAYLHRCEVMHGDLRAANVLIDGKGQCVLSNFAQREIKSEAHRACGEPEHCPSQWKAPEILVGDDQVTKATDVYAFAMCCVEILGVGDLPWPTLHDRAIHDLVLHKNERPSIPLLAGNVEAANSIADLVRLCWVREPDGRPAFAKIATSLKEMLKVHGHVDTHPSTPLINVGLALAPSTGSSPADEQYETASESMTTQAGEEDVSDLVDIPLTSPVPASLDDDTVDLRVRTNAGGDAGFVKVSAQMTAVVLEPLVHQMHTSSPTNELGVETRNEANYRLIMGSNHSFHSSLTLPLWSPTHVEIGAVGYLSKPRGEFITLLNAIDPLQSSEERLRRLPSMYGYGKFEIQKREDGKRSVAQRGFDAISGFLAFKARNDRVRPERIVRQYAFPLVEGIPAAYLCVEKTVHWCMDHLEVPMTWFKQHAELILAVHAPGHAIQKEDLILVTGTLDAPDWAIFVSEDHSHGRAQFNVFAGREKGESWGMYTMERAFKSGNSGTARWLDVDEGMFASKVSCATGGHDVVGDTVLLAGMRFERGMETPTAMSL